MNKISFGNGLSIFKRVQAERQSQQTNNNHHNPFGVSFKGNILTADVFELTSQERVSFTGKIAQKGKLFQSAMVASLEKITAPIASRVKNAAKIVTEFWSKVKQFELTQYNISDIANPFKVTKNSKEALAIVSQHPQDAKGIEPMLENAIALRIAN